MVQKRRGEIKMATNWTMAHAAKKIVEGTDTAAIQDIGRRFPLTSVAVASMGENSGAMKIIGALPQHITVRKIEAVLKGDVQDMDEDDDIQDEEEEAEEKPAKKEKAEKPKANLKKPAKKEVEEEIDEDEDDDEEEADPVALYKQCKKAGLKVPPKKDASFYQKALDKAKAESDKAAKATKKSKAKDEDDAEDEDEDNWDI